MPTLLGREDIRKRQACNEWTVGQSVSWSVGQLVGLSQFPKIARSFTSMLLTEHFFRWSYFLSALALLWRERKATHIALSFFFTSGCFPMGAILFQMTIQALQCLEMANQSIVNYRGMLNIYLTRKKLAW